MGVSWQYVDRLEELGAFKRRGCRILDIGSSNLYSASAQEITSFVKRHNDGPRSDLEAFAARMAAGSAYDMVKGGSNESFVGEVFEAAGFGYEAMDIADGYKTTIVDLNHETLPANFRGRFDLVMNFGTTEHILNQFNSFRAIHDAAKAGGCIFHQLPSVGYVDHGYFTYTARFFFDLAAYNKYDIVDIWLDGPAGPENAFTAVRIYQRRFPAVARRLAQIGVAERETAIDRCQVPTIAINVLLRKAVNSNFMGAVETSTSVGKISSAVRERYGSEGVVGRISNFLRKQYSRQR